jgi:glutamate formiminotransferase/formiminotetrahydrofolate cyclodeaminase
VKALGLEVDGQAQVSMNLVDIEKTPIYRAFEMVRMEALARGVAPTWSEIVGLVPERALLETAARHLQLRGFSQEMVLEHRVRLAMSGGASLTSYVAEVAAPTPAPGGGSVAAHVAALGAALAQMVAGLTVGRRRYAAVEAEMQTVAREAAELVNELNDLAARDSRAYEAVMAAYRLPKDTPDQASARQAAITGALIEAARVPLETARACARVARLAATAAEKGNTNAASDAGVAALLAEAACRGASYNVQINVSTLADSATGNQLLEDTMQAVEECAGHARLAAEAVQRAITASAL